MSTANDLNVTGLIGYKLKQVQHLLRIQMDDAIKPLGLTTPQYAVLAQLELNSGISNADLARAAFITAQTMHGIITNLEKHRLITRKKDTQHGRILCIELTQEGKEVVQKAHTIIKSVESRMTKTMNTNDKNLLEQLLSTCLRNLT